MSRSAPADSRPAAFPALLFVAGLILARVLIEPWIAIAGVTAICLLIGAMGRTVTRALIGGFLVFGLAIGVWHGEHRTAIDSLQSRDKFITIRAPIEGSWNETATGYRLRASRFSAATLDVGEPITIYLSARPPRLEASAEILVEGFLIRGESGRFSLSCKSPQLIRYSGTASPFHPRSWNRFADSHLTRFAAQNPAYLRQVALAKAIALGRSDELSPEIREDYRRGGTYHLLVFSGMQIALAAAAITLLFRWRGIPRAGDWALFGLALTAPLFAGNEPSVTRAAIMIGVYSASRLLRRPTSIENLFYVSLLLRLILRPGELTDPGFALTYAAAGGLLFIGRPLASCATNRVVAMILYGCGAELATAPLTLLFFHQFVIGGSVVTIILAPVLAVMLGLAAAACAFVFVSSSATALSLDLLGLLDQLATAVNSFSGSTLHLSRMGLAPPGELVAGTFALFLLLDLLRRRLISNVPVLLIPFLYSFCLSLWLREAENPRIEFLDVGQADAILLRTGRSSILVDGGGRRDDPEFGRRTLLPKLLDRGVRQIDVLALTHPHPDHCGGMLPVIEHLEVRQVWLSAAHLKEPCANELANASFDRRIPVRLAGHAVRSRIGDFDLELSASHTRFKRATLNNGSLVCRIHIDSRTVLLTGDIEKEAEKELVAAGSPLSADLLKVPHHGGRNSTTAEFVDRVRPRIAVISCGRRNPFGHPHPTVINRLRATGTRIWYTHRHGDIRVDFQRQRIFVRPQIDTLRGAP